MRGLIKGHGRAKGRRKWASRTKTEILVPAMSTKAVFLLPLVVAKGGRDVMTMVIPGAFLQTELRGKRVHLRFNGRMTEMLAMMDPMLYPANIIVDHEKPMLYQELQRTLYRMVQKTLRVLEWFLDDLVKFGFIVNPYDWCAANRSVNGSQQTVKCHANDFFVTNVDHKMSCYLAACIRKKYGKLTSLAVHIGKVRDNLGIGSTLEEQKRCG